MSVKLWLLFEIYLIRFSIEYGRKKIQIFYMNENELQNMLLSTKLENGWTNSCIFFIYSLNSEEDFIGTIIDQDNVCRLCLDRHSVAQKFRMDYMWAHSYKTFYRLHDLATDWNQARQICESEGTTLLIPDTLDEVENLKLLMSNMKAHYTAIFVGIHDSFAVGNFVTVRGEPIAGTTLELLWAEGRPDNLNGTEHCVVMTREGLFDDRPCSKTYPFVCKILGNDTKYNNDCDNFDSGYTRDKTISDKCYKFHSEPLSWHDAYLACKLEEGRLAIINSAKEASIVVGFLGDNLNSNTPDPNILYLGFSDLMFPYQVRTIVGQTLDEAGYESWSPVQDNLKKKKLKRCGAISRTGFLLMTFCDRPAMFLCERILNSSISN